MIKNDNLYRITYPHNDSAIILRVLIFVFHIWFSKLFFIFGFSKLFFIFCFSYFVLIFCFHLLFFIFFVIFSPIFYHFTIFLVHSLAATEIVVPPQAPNGGSTIKEGRDLVLVCNATYDPNLQLRIHWEKDGERIKTFDSRFLLERRVGDAAPRLLIIRKLKFEDRGNYTCKAYTILSTTANIRSEDTSTHYLSVSGMLYCLSIYVCSLLISNRPEKLSQFGLYIYYI